MPVSGTGSGDVYVRGLNGYLSFFGGFKDAIVLSVIWGATYGVWAVHDRLCVVCRLIDRRSFYKARA